MNRIIKTAKRYLQNDNLYITSATTSTMEKDTTILSQWNEEVMQKVDYFVIINSNVRMNTSTIIMRVVDGFISGVVITNYVANNGINHTRALKSIIDAFSPRLVLSNDAEFLEAKSISDMNSFSNLEVPVYMVKPPNGVSSNLDLDIITQIWDISAFSLLIQVVSENKNLDDVLSDFILRAEKDIEIMNTKSGKSVFDFLIRTLLSEYEEIARKTMPVKNIYEVFDSRKLQDIRKSILMPYIFNDSLSQVVKDYQDITIIKNHPQYNVQEALRYAVKYGYIEMTIRLVNEGGDPLDPLLMYNAISRNHLPIVKYLISKGSTHIDIRALENSLKNGSSVLKYVLFKGLVPAFQDIEYIAMSAGAIGNADALKYLKSEGVDLTINNYYILRSSIGDKLDILRYYVEEEGFRDFALIANIALTRTSFISLRYLVSAGLDVTDIDSGAYIKFLKMDDDIVEIVQLLNDNGYDVLQENAVQVALDAGAVNIFDYFISELGQRIPEDASISNQLNVNNHAMAMYLLKKGYPVSDRIQDRSSLVWYAVKEQRDTIPLLKRLGFYTPEIVTDVFHKLVLYGGLDSVKYFIETENIDVTIDNNKAIIHAALFSKWDTVRYLISLGADINAREWYLMRSANMLNKPSVVSILLELGSLPIEEIQTIERRFILQPIIFEMFMLRGMRGFNVNDDLIPLEHEIWEDE